MTANPHVVTMTITFKNTDATEALRAYAEEKLLPIIKRFVRHDTEAHLVMRLEKIRHIAEISLNADGVAITNSEESDDLYKSLDKLVDSLSNQLRRHKEKKSRHH